MNEPDHPSKRVTRRGFLTVSASGAPGSVIGAPAARGQQSGALTEIHNVDTRPDRFSRMFHLRGSPSRRLRCSRR